MNGRAAVTIMAACLGAGFAAAEMDESGSGDQATARVRGVQDVLLRTELELELADPAFDVEDFRRRVFTWYVSHRGERPAFVPVWSQRWSQSTRDMRPQGDRP